jgi:crotonobetainyl-CoA:carnitine CoA-transferase CaiB-like acyl-CoA transferase
MISHPMAGVLVVDFTQYVAGPVCTRAMAELGAEVIKIELAPQGDLARAMPVKRNGRSAYFIQQNLGKRSLCVDLRDKRGLDLVKRLIAKAEVMVENFSPGTIARLGLGWEVVHALNPELILCSVSAFGQSGPLSQQPGFDFIAQAYTGVTAMIGDKDGIPPMAGVAIGDVGAGVTALAMIHAALYGRLKHGDGGRWLDVALIDFYFHSHGLAVELASASGGTIKPTRNGSRHFSVVPAGIYKSREGHIVLVPVGEEMWRRLAGAVDRADLLDDPRFADSAERARHVEVLEQIITDWLQAQPSDAVALGVLQQHRVPCAPVLSVEDAMRHPHLVERYTVRDVEDAALGLFQVPGPLLHVVGQPPVKTPTAPSLGEHNADVLSRHLGFGTAEIAVLEGDGVLRRDVG